MALSLSAQQPKQFVQAELLKTIKTKNAKVGDPVKARTVNAVVLPGGVNVSVGAILLGEVRSVDGASLAISFDRVEQDSTNTPLILSIRAARMPGESPKSQAAQTGAVIGMAGVSLQVDDSPRHESKFASDGKELQLNKGLQLMLAVP
jgi:hypothetical protein